MAYIILLNTYFLNKNGEAAIKVITLPTFKLNFGVFDTIEELRSKLEERIKDFKNGRLYYCDMLNECVLCDSIECIADDISCILKYRGYLFNKASSLKINGNDDGYVDVIEEYYIQEFKVGPFNESC